MVLSKLHIQLCQQKADDLLIGPDESKSYTVPVYNNDDVKLNPNITVLTNQVGKMQKHCKSRVIRFHKVSILKNTDEHYLIVLQPYMAWRNENELKKNKQL